MGRTQRRSVHLDMLKDDAMIVRVGQTCGILGYEAENATTNATCEFTINMSQLEKHVALLMYMQS